MSGWNTTSVLRDEKVWGMILSMLVAAPLYAIFIGLISSNIASLNRSTDVYMSHVSATEQFANYYGLNNALRQRIRNMLAQKYPHKKVTGNAFHQTTSYL